MQQPARSAPYQIEGNLVAPIVQRQLIFIPPAVMPLAIVTVLFVFGKFSVIFAGPIAVITGSASRAASICHQPEPQRRHADQLDEFAIAPPIRDLRQRR